MNDDIETVDVPPERKVIAVVVDQLHEVASEAEETLIAAEAPIFQRGTSLVMPVSMEVAAADGRKTVSPTLKVVDKPTLRDHLSRVARFTRFDGRSQKMVAIAPPEDVAAFLLSRAGEWRLRPLAGVITTPTMRADGSILTEPGYDAATELYYIVTPNTDLRGLVAERPTREDAVAALGLLQGLLVEFPFKTDVDRAVALSAVLCTVTRAAAPIAPLHVFDAPEAGSGKSYVCDVVAAIGIGSYCPVIAADKKDEETDKRLVGLLLAGLPIVSIDNVTTPLGSPTLCQATERPLVTVRPLGTSELVSIESRAMFLATGNNLRLVGDMVRRSLRAELDAQMERPETRTFTSDPFRTVLSARNLYIAAALTIVRAYLVSGERINLPPVQSYGAWSRFVREPLVWLGCEDPARSMEAIRDDDPDRSAFLAIVVPWYEVFGEEERTVAEITEAVKDASTENRRALAEAIRLVAGVAGRDIDNKRFGVWLRSNKEKRYGGYRLEATTTTKSGMRRWKVVGPEPGEREAPPPDSDETGEESDEAHAAWRERYRLRLRVIKGDENTGEG